MERSMHHNFVTAFCDPNTKHVVWEGTWDSSKIYLAIKTTCALTQYRPEDFKINSHSISLKMKNHEHQKIE